MFQKDQNWMVKRSGLVQGLFLWQKMKELDHIEMVIAFIMTRFWMVLSKLSSLIIFFLKLLMYIFKLLIQIQISLSIGNLYLADKVTHIVNKIIQYKTNKTQKMHLGIQVHTQ